MSLLLPSHALLYRSKFVSLAAPTLFTLITTSTQRHEFLDEGRIYLSLIWLNSAVPLLKEDTPTQFALTSDSFSLSLTV